MPPFVIDNRYRFLRALGTGGMGEVACVFDRLTGTQVALKRVRLDAEGRSSGEVSAGGRSLGGESTLFLPPGRSAHTDTVQGPLAGGASTLVRDTLRLALAQEFHTLASLRHPHIISVLDYGFDSERRPFFTMELVSDARPLREATRGLPLPAKLELLAQLLRALGYLHRRGVLHRDLKPSNVLVARQNETDCIKVLDFGLALGKKSQRLRAEIAGTLGYIAPEVLLGAPPSEASDLYSVGVLAYEVLAEQALSEQMSDTRLLQRLFEPDRRLELSSLHELGPVRAFMSRLMEREAGARFPSAAAALAALSAAAGHSVSADSEGVRESYLQAAPLTGRDREWSELQGYVERLMNGAGAGLLIAGESGVGKSRLLEELRTHALVQGARVVQGQAISGGGGAYHVFQQAIRLLCLAVPLTDAQGGILKALAPDLPRLLERPLPDAPVIDAQAAQSRLHNTLESVLCEVQAPLVLVLEDLHWADGESIALLRRLLSVAQTRPILVVGTFRDDERPRLADELQGTSVLKLSRLPKGQIEDLCVSMLGELPRPELLDFMARETEGNVFFVVEIMRALAEEAGGLGAIGKQSLPQRVLTGGIQTILQRRIEQVAPLWRPSLRLMAVAGRQLDLKVAQQFEPRLEELLAACADAAVLEVSERNWRFTHDKLREALLAELSADERSRLHRQVAEAIESAYPDAALQATALAYHYREAGMERQAADFGILAGEQALGQGALTEAVSLLKSVEALLDKLPDTPLLKWARGHRLLGQALFGLHDAHECVRICEKALSRLHPARWGHSGKLRQALSMLHLVGEHALHQAVTTSVRIETDSARRALLHEELLIILAAGETYAYLGRPLDLLRAILGGNELARALDDVPLQAFTTSVAAFLLEFTPLRALAGSYLQQAQGLVGRTSNPLAEAHVCRVGGIAVMNGGQVERGADMLDRAASLFRALGDDFMLLFSLGQAGLCRILMGHTAEAERIFAEMESLALHGRHYHAYRDKLAWAGLLALRRGQHAAVYEQLLAAFGQMDPHRDPLITVAVLMGIIAASLRLEKFEEVRRCALLMIDLLPPNPTGFNYFVALSTLIDGYLTLWERQPGGLESADSAALQRGLTLLRTYAAAIPLSRAQAYWLESRLAVLRGQSKLAEERAEASLKLALKLRLPYEEALAHEQLGRIATVQGASTPAAVEHLRRASILYHRFGDLLRAQKLDEQLAKS